MEHFGAALAGLHRHTAALHGLDRDNFIGRLPQPNTQTASWVEFYRDQRIFDFAGALGMELRHLAIHSLASNTECP